MNLIDRVDDVCAKIDNSLNELFVKLLESKFTHFTLIELQERFLAPAYTETFFDHTALLMRQNPCFEEILTPILVKEIDTIRQNTEDGEKFLASMNYYTVETLEEWKTCCPTVYEECKTSVLQLSKRYIVSSNFKSIRAIFMLAKLQEMLGINKDRVKPNKKLPTRRDFDTLFYKIILAKHDPESEYPEIIEMSAEKAFQLYELYQKTVIRSVKTCSDGF